MSNNICFQSSDSIHAQAKTFSGLGNGIEKNQEASFGGYTTILKQLCLWVKGHAGFSIANVFSTTFVTDPASVSNYGHKSKAVAAAAFYLKMEVYLPKHFAYSHEACRVNPAADASPIRTHLITFTDSNQKDMLQSLQHSKSPARRKQQEVLLSHSKKLTLHCQNQCFLTYLLINMAN